MNRLSAACCAFEGCEARAAFGYAPPLVKAPLWCCRAHRQWVEDTQVAPARRVVFAAAEPKETPA